METLQNTADRNCRILVGRQKDVGQHGAGAGLAMSSGNTNGSAGVFVDQLAQKDGTLNDPRNLRATGRDKLRINPS